ncbi:hypothetical protein AB0K14_01580 [Actinosynnema sp. NPDC050801]|uniref:hypothetical protein n=1 Tax=unclassified Actinosynnema TaxID=2637065 RepID=UPI0034026219
MTVELDDRLRELFADERLDLPARPDAAEVIVTGARRRRRARVAVASTFALTLLVGGGVAVSGVGGSLLGEPASPAPSTAPLPVRTSGYPVLRLGMPAQEARANPALTLTRIDTCEFYSLPDVPGDAVAISPRYGVARITRPATSVTPTSLLGVGTPAGKVLEHYPEAVRRDDLITVRLPGTPEWRYAFPLDDAGEVTAVRLELVGSDCPLGGG